MMKTLPNPRSILSTLVVLTAVSALALPLAASASARNINISYDKAELETRQGQERLYKRLQSASRELCGETNLKLTGSLEDSVGNKQCYEGTLTAVVERLDHDAITALHTK